MRKITERGELGNHGKFGAISVQKCSLRGKFAVCLTHDVDELRKKYQYVTRSVRFLKCGNIRGIKNEILSLFEKLRGREPYWTFEELSLIHISEPTRPY